MKPSHFLTVLGVLMFIGLVAMAQQSETKPIDDASLKYYSPEQKKETASFEKNRLLQTDFPAQPIKKDGTVDYEAYRVAKEKWIADNPELYSKMNRNPGKAEIPYHEFMILSPEKKDKVLSNPQNYIIVR